jgi:hypothetical protein
VPDNSGIAPLGTVVAPYLRSLGMAGTGTLVTGVAQATAPNCTHFGDSLSSSWADAANLATNFGWSFVSHTATYPGQLGKLTPTQSYIAKIQALQPGQWFTLQAYILVTGTNPGYAHNATRWDCTSPNPALHWTNDNERYCYSDWQQIVNAIAAMPNVTVTDPLTVGVAFGRPASYP